MFFTTHWAFAIILAGTTPAPFAVDGQQMVPSINHPNARPVSPYSVTAQLTGKERLGEKWKDEQRIDNCKVPLDKRGTKPRPDSCGRLPTS